MVHELEALKERMIRGEKLTKDIDIINSAIDYIKELEANRIEPAILESEPLHSVVIQSATIYINDK